MVDPSPNLGRRFTPLALTVALLLVLLALSVPAVAEKNNKGKDKGPTEQDLKQAERNLAQAQERASELGKDIGRTRARIQTLKSEIAATQHEVEGAEEEYALALETLKETEREQSGVQEENDVVRTVMDTRVREAYIDGPSGPLDLLFTATSLSNMTERQAFLEALQAQDANTSLTLRKLTHDLQSLKREQKEQTKEAERLLKYLEEEREALKTKATEQTTLVDTLEKAEHEAKGLIKKFGVKVEVIAEKLNTYVIGSGNGPLYACPVPEYTWWSNDFGAPRVGHTHQGNDIGASQGAEILAPFDGNASMSSDSLGGLTVTVSGKDGYVYNAHLVKYGKSGRVDAGDVVGYVGATGNAQGTSPHNHFEWHPNGGSAIDPYDVLSEVCK